ncbi:MAG: hypothetical protein DI623_03800 [Sphingomonas sanxanigenens]|uniref:Uncharacterized protein n=1 Tax=Sphingomonas sanxanigenens TaxID=397260 RepID=A0A2W5C893_9SPHN|nr:MAG: hypothetical protein DI623_03800 [Sphingomonas sanxanigenens]
MFNAPFHAIGRLRFPASGEATAWPSARSEGMSRINQSVARAAHMIRVRASTQAGVGNALRKAYDGQRDASLPADLMELLAKLR